VCQSSVYIVDEGQEQLLLEEVALLEVKGDQVTLKTLFDEPASLLARVKEIDLVKHRIVLER